MAIIVGDNVALRHFTEQDIPALLRWGTDPELNRLLEGDYPSSKDAYVDWLRQLKSDRHRQAFAIQLADGRFIGDIELDHIAWRSGDAELRIRIGEPDCHGRGYGTEALRLLLEYAFENLNLRRIYLRVFQFNRRAIASYRKVGFKKEGALVRTTAGGVPTRVILMRVFHHEFLSASNKTAQGIAVEM